MDLAFASAAELAAQIRKRAVSPVEVVRGALERIERSQPTLNAFITVAGDKAMAEAHAAEAAVMQDGQLGKLHGVPVAVKDLIPTAGIRTTWGSLIFNDHVPDHDSVAVARLRQAGAIVVGKTTTPEFGQQCLTQSATFRPHPQCLASRPQFGRLQRRLCGCCCRGLGADRGRHRRWRIDAHSCRVQRHRRVQAI